VIKQLVNKSVSADLRAIKQLIDIVERVEGRSGAAPTPPSPAFSAADEEVITELKKRMERDIRAKIAAEASFVVTPAESGGPGAKSAAVSPSAHPPGRACLGQALDSAFAGIMGWTFPLASLRQTGSCGPDTSQRVERGKAHGRD